MRFSILYIIIGATLISSCSKEEKTDYTGIEIYGHGGNGFESHTNQLPTNSFKSIQKAIEILSADGEELDLQIDNDGKAWLYHEQFLESKTNCSGCFGEQSSTTVNSCSYKLGGSIYSLQELINYFSTMSPKPKVSLQVQIFDRCVNTETLTSSIYQVIEANNAYDWIQIESDSEEILSSLKEASNRFILFKNAQEVNNGIDVCLNKGYQGLIIDNDNISKNDVVRAKSLGLKVGVFGIES